MQSLFVGRSLETSLLLQMWDWHLRYNQLYQLTINASLSSLVQKNGKKEISMETII